MEQQASQPFQEWQQRLRSICGPFEIRLPSTPSSFAGSAGRLDLGGLEIARIRSNVAALVRGRRVVAKENDHCFLILQVAGHQHVVAGGAEAIELRTGDMALVDASLPFEMIMHGRVDNLSVHLPRRLLAQQLRRRYMTGKLEPELVTTSLLGALLARLGDVSPGYLASPAEGAALRSAIFDMLSSVLAGSPPAPGAGKNADLYGSACALIDKHLADPALEPGWLAEQLSISRRQLYRLFADRGELGVSRYVLDRRLDRAAALLRDADAKFSMADIALAVGIEDQGHFSRTFHRRFSVPPTRYRGL